MPDFSSLIRAHRPDLATYEDLYKRLHANPGLSLQESLAATIAAEHLNEYGFVVRSNVGGYGVFGVLKNGPGRTILLRADTDALPVEEQTGLSYASKKREVDVEDGMEKSVMHACGHDMHIACMLAAAKTLSTMTDCWQGTLVIVFQPNEERGKGALAMIADGLYDPAGHACPIPDVVLGQHVMPFPAGQIGTRRGIVASAADSLKITLYGRGGHGSQPHRTVDVVVLASYIVVRLQSIVSREVGPTDSVVVTVGAVQAGVMENIISDHAVIRVSVRNIDLETRARVLSAIRRVVIAECQASNTPKEPVFETTLQMPITRNNDEVTAALEGPFREHFGDNYNNDALPLGGSEDFAFLAEAVDRPYCYWTFGGSDLEKWREAEANGNVQESIPVNHSPFFAPPIQPTLTTGTDAMVVGALTFLGK